METEKIKNAIPEELPEPAPSITPELVKSTLEILESKGLVYLTEKAAYIPTQKGWRLLTEIKTVKEEIEAVGHKNLDLTSEESISLTKSEEIKSSTIGIKANKAAKDLREDFKNAAKQGRRIEIKIEVDGLTETLFAFGSPALLFESSDVLEIRKDDEINKATVAILANKSAKNLGEEVKKALKEGKKVKVILIVRAD